MQGLVIKEDFSISFQIKEHFKGLILKGLMKKNDKLPSTRVVSNILKVSRNSVIKAYEELYEEELIYFIDRKGAFVNYSNNRVKENWNMNWKEKVNPNVRDDLDSRVDYGSEINSSFKDISPNEELFDMEGFKRAYGNAIGSQGSNLLNYGSIKGYDPLGKYLLNHMKDKGVHIDDKDILITNGDVEAFSLILDILTKEGDKVVCENPTSDIYLNVMKEKKLHILGLSMEENGIDESKLDETLCNNHIKLGFLIPSYHSPTGIVMAASKRSKIFNLFKEHNVPLIEAGFNEELRYSCSHVLPIIGLEEKSNGVVFIGSFSKVLYPGLNVGWIIGDKNLISYLVKVKSGKNNRTSNLNQAILYEYLNDGNLEKYIKRIRPSYKEKYNFVLECVKNNISCEQISGDGSKHLFLTLNKEINTNELLSTCIKRGVDFIPGDKFFIDKRGTSTLRLSFSNLSREHIKKGLEIIGEEVDRFLKNERGN